jgi:hypothetical protein
VGAMLYEVATNPHFKGLWGNVAQIDSNAFNISFLGITYLLTHLLIHLLTYLLTQSVWVHYNNKYVELLDTVWMVLKKKNDQVSFLHCYHHLLLIW